jgi:hypothetical protein
MTGDYHVTESWSEAIALHQPSTGARQFASYTNTKRACSVSGPAVEKAYDFWSQCGACQWNLLVEAPCSVVACHPCDATASIHK